MDKAEYLLKSRYPSTKLGMIICAGGTVGRIIAGYTIILRNLHNEIAIITSNGTINKNHESKNRMALRVTVEKNVNNERVQFLKKLLEYNKFTVSQFHLII